LGEANRVAVGDDDVGVVQEPIDGGVGDGLGHRFVEAGWVQVRRQRDGAFLVGGIDDAVERFRGLCGDWEQSDVDELGYVQLDTRGAELLFQILTEREEKASIATASNLPFSEWGKIITDLRLVAAILDRVTFHAHFIETGSDSYRLRSTTNARQPITAIQLHHEHSQPNQVDKPSWADMLDQIAEALTEAVHEKDPGALGRIWRFTKVAVAPILVVGGTVADSMSIVDHFASSAKVFEIAHEIVQRAD